MPISAILDGSPSRLLGWDLFIPSLALNYLGQGALVLADPKAIENPFFLLYPDWALLPMVVLATVATVIASQAVITGAYSITQQAIQLGLLPRLEIRHTSEAQYGQIYMPRVNWFLLVGVLLLVALFRSSSALASAYGIAVTGTMVVTGVMAFVVIRNVWNWSWMAAAALMFPFLFIDLTFLGANLLKVDRGGWVPLAFGGLVMVADVYLAAWDPAFVRKDATTRDPARRPCAHAGKKAAPACTGDGRLSYQHSGLRAHCSHAQPEALQGAARRTMLSLPSIRTRPARGPQASGWRIESVGPDLYSGAASLRLHGEARMCRGRSPSRASWVGHSTSCPPRFFSPAGRSSRRRARECRLAVRLFIMLARMANDATDYFQIPTGRVVEVENQVTI